MRSTSIVVATVCLLAAAAPARAEAEGEDAADAVVDARAERPFAINLSLGVGTEYGILTLDRQWRLADHLVIDVGVGVGVAGFKGHVFPKLEARLSNHGWITLGAGVNLGQHRWIEQLGWCWDDTCAEKRTSAGVSATTALSLEYRSSKRWRFGPYAGAEALLNPSAMTCEGSDEALEHCESAHEADGERRIFAGLRVTRMF